MLTSGQVGHELKTVGRLVTAYRAFKWIAVSMATSMNGKHYMVKKDASAVRANESGELFHVVP